MANENLHTDKKICPYPGLRPFAEKESLFFKGRDHQVASIISMLEEKRFVMVTGASGEGKSSLVYAGVVPNARAGFFKAEFNNWRFLNFKPERTPLKNFAKVTAEKLELDIDKAEKELKYGFSALVDMYKSSRFHIDKNGDEWKQANEEERKELKKKGANLLILVDQFEEFFTYPENFHKEKLSLDAQLVVNLLLEAADISKAQDLPIYIVFTMRSDYIGKCAGFRGLPEFIGFSQFYVPRLSRRELYQVIEEPIQLSGGLISSRIVEYMINELREGRDQLPILQHALNQLWQIADQGEKEIDLLDLAKLSGIPPNYLQKKDRNLYNEWFNTLSEEQRRFHQSPSLSNILNNHANLIYDGAYEYCQAHSTSEDYKPSRVETDEIIKTTFQCLTKTDKNRLVRNRMTLQEITDVLSRPKIDSDVVGRVINIFREEGNTLISPYFFGKKGEDKLQKDVVLDISHESLIRNWDLLKGWVAEENEKWLNFQDFNKQMARWLGSNKSADYLLPVGPLNYFEKWYNDTLPNKYWLAKYDEQIIPLREKVERSSVVIANVQNYLKESRAHYEYGQKKIKRRKKSMVSSIVLVILVLTATTFWALDKSRVAEVQKQAALESRGAALQAKSETDVANKLAVKAKGRAEENEKLAVGAKEQAEKSNSEAVKSKELAEQERNKAEGQRKIAHVAKERAEKQSQIALEEKERAEVAEKKSNTVSRLSLAQSMALISVDIKERHDLKALLAVHAFILNRNNGGIKKDAFVHSALLNAYISYHKENPDILGESNFEQKSMASVKDGKQIVSTGNDGVVYFWDTRTLELKETNRLLLMNRSPQNYQEFSNDGRFLAIGHDNNVVSLWEFASPGKLVMETTAPKGLMRAAAFSEDREFVVTGGKDNSIILWASDTAGLRKVSEISTPAEVKSLVFSPLGQSFFAATSDGLITEYDVKSLSSNVICNYESGMPLSLEVIKSKNHLIAGFSDGKMRLYNLSHSTEHYEEFDDHLSDVRLLKLSPDEELLVTVGGDKKIKVYSLDHLDWKPIEFKDHDVQVRSVAFDNKGRIFAGCEDNSIRYWETDSEKVFDVLAPLIKRSLTQEEWSEYLGEEIPYNSLFEIDQE